MMTYRERNKPERLFGTVLTLNNKGETHIPGTVLQQGGTTYRMMEDGSMRRVMVFADADGVGVRCAPVRRMTRVEKKAAKRRRVHA